MGVGDGVGVSVGVAVGMGVGVIGAAATSSPPLPVISRDPLLSKVQVTLAPLAPQLPEAMTSASSAAATPHSSASRMTMVKSIRFIMSETPFDNAFLLIPFYHCKLLLSRGN